MHGTSAGFVDAGYLIAEGAKAIDKRPTQVLPRASYVTEWLSRQANGQIIRTYWYDGALPTTHPRMKSSVATSMQSPTRRAYNFGWDTWWSVNRGWKGPCGGP